MVALHLQIVVVAFDSVELLIGDGLSVFQECGVQADVLVRVAYNVFVLQCFFQLGYLVFQVGNLQLLCVYLAIFHFNLCLLLRHFVLNFTFKALHLG